jgi:hypothetical protein
VQTDPRQAAREWYDWLCHQLSELPSETAFSHLAKHTAAVYVRKSAPAGARRAMVAAFMETAIQLYHAEVEQRRKPAMTLGEEHELKADPG